MLLNHKKKSSKMKFSESAVSKRNLIFTPKPQPKRHLVAIIQKASSFTHCLIASSRFVPSCSPLKGGGTRDLYCDSVQEQNKNLQELSAPLKLYVWLTAAV